MRAENPENAGARSGALDGAERERERERCVSDADASSYGPFRARNDPHHTCPHRTHANTTPHHLRPGPSPLHPLQRALKSTSEDRPKPSLFPCPQPGSTSAYKYIHKPTNFASPNCQVRNKPLWKADPPGRAAHDRRHTSSRGASSSRSNTIVRSAISYCSLIAACL